MPPRFATDRSRGGAAGDCLRPPHRNRGQPTFPQVRATSGLRVGDRPRAPAAVWPCERPAEGSCRWAGVRPFPMRPSEWTATQS
jgi:hypothetical protein